MIKKINIKNNKYNIYLLGYIFAYFIVNLIILTRFPSMHSDESWLSGLSRSMMNSGLGATEYFFDILPRYPHAIKTIFHILQIIFIAAFGYNLFAVRLLSLLFGIGCLVVFYKILEKFTKSKNIALIGTVILSLDIQFIYASHFARQEIVILFLVLLIIHYIFSHADNWSIKNDIISAALIGVSVGVHPNSFFVAIIVGTVYLYYLLIEKKFKIKNLMVLVATTILCALIFIGLSYLMNANFIEDYQKYGDNLGVTSKGIMKIFAFPAYYKKLFNGFSVTYYTPPIKIQLILFAISVFIGLLGALFIKNMKNTLIFILPILTINFGFLVLGRYSQPSIILLFPICYLLLFVLLNRFKRIKYIAFAVLGSLIIANSVLAITPYINNDYNEYLKNIQNEVAEDSKVLANLNTEYAFSFGKMYDYRNLDFLETGGFASYIEDRDIEYIVYSEEMDLSMKIGLCGM